MMMQHSVNTVFILWFENFLNKSKRFYHCGTMGAVLNVYKICKLCTAVGLEFN